MHRARSSHRVLVASTPRGDALVRSILAPLELEVLSAYTQDEAIERVRDGVDLVVCSLRFDESRMLDLVAQVGRSSAHPPVVCCRVLDSDLPEASLHAAFIAAGYLGAVAVVNLPDVARREGRSRAEEALRASVAAHLHDIGHASSMS